MNNGLEKVAAGLTLAVPDQPRGQEKAASHEEGGGEALCGLEYGAGYGRPQHGRRTPEHRDEAKGGGQLVDAHQVHQDDGGGGYVGGNEEAEQGGKGDKHAEGVEEGEGEHTA